MTLLIYLIGLSIVYVLDKLSKDEEVTKEVLIKRIVFSLFSWVTLFLFLLVLVITSILDDVKQFKK